MPHDASGDVRLPHVNDLRPDVATFMIARAFAETYRDVLDAPVPEPARRPSCGRWKARRLDHEPMQPEPHLALIVEDDPDVRDLAAALLEETALDVVEVESCRSGPGLPPGARGRGRDDVCGCPPARERWTGSSSPRPPARSGRRSGSC